MIQSFGYQILQYFAYLTHSFIAHLYEHLGMAFQPIFKIGLVGLCIWFGVMIMQRKEGKLLQIAPKLLVMLLTIELAFNTSLFMTFIYEPVISVIFGMANYIIFITAQVPHANLGEGSMFDMFSAIELSTSKMMYLGAEVEAQHGWLLGAKAKFQGWLLSVLYFGLYIVFMGQFLLGFIGANIMLALVPIVIALSVFPPMKGVLANQVKSFLIFALMPVFNSIVMGLTLHLLRLQSDKAEAILSQNQGGELPTAFFMQSVIMGGISIFFHMKASMFSSYLVNRIPTNYASNATPYIRGAVGAVSPIAHIFGGGIAGGSDQKRGYIRGVSGHAGYTIGKIITHGYRGIRDHRREN